LTKLERPLAARRRGCPRCGAVLRHDPDADRDVVLVYAGLPGPDASPDAPGLASFKAHLSFAELIQLEVLRRCLVARRDGLEEAGANDALAGCCYDCRRRHCSVEFAAPVRIENVRFILPDNGRDRGFDATPLADLLPLAREEERAALTALRAQVVARVAAGCEPEPCEADPWPEDRREADSATAET
jgi:hypothetical protein